MPKNGLVCVCLCECVHVHTCVHTCVTVCAHPSLRAVSGDDAPRLSGNFIRMTARCRNLDYWWQDPLASEIDLNAFNILSATVQYCRKITNTCQVVNFTAMLRVNLLFDSSNIFTVPNVTKRNQRNKSSYTVFQILGGAAISLSTLMLLNLGPPW